MQAAAEPALLKPARVCLPCKSRHRRCDWEEGACAQCKAANIECLPQPTLRFRYHAKQKALSRAPPSFWQPCPLPQVPVRFYDETSEVRAHYREADSPRHSDASSPIHHVLDDCQPVANVARDVLESCYVGSHVPDVLEQYHPSLDDMMDDAEGSLAGSRRQDAHTPAHDRCTELPPLSPTEALLLRNFTDHMALWTDVADPYHTFATTVSRLALTDLIIRSALCAFSARHFYRCQGGNEDVREALYHQNRCLSLLIPSMSGGQRVTATMLTAVALLRQNEEMDGQ